MGFSYKSQITENVSQIGSNDKKTRYNKAVKK